MSAETRQQRGLLSSVLVVCTLAAAAAHAAPPRDTAVHVERIALPRSIVFDIGQDSRGFMWFATDGGLYRFDGYRARRDAGLHVRLGRPVDVEQRHGLDAAPGPRRLRLGRHECRGQRTGPRERTAQLELANKELEAFSYSVSHDLRAPLRAIDGFSRILVTKHAATLPPEGSRYLRLILESTERMGHLIDDLLALSRISKQSLVRRPVDMNDLVRQALEELAPSLAGRTIEFATGALPGCAGDPALLRQVWINLLSNAIKFTSTGPSARVEIGWQNRPSDPAYVVRDDGVGFQMEYAHKLFGVFQRLHRADEFSGAGVGLSIVQRIVHRHGGRVWADSTPGQGATFCFTVAAGEPALGADPR